MPPYPRVTAPRAALLACLVTWSVAGVGAAVAAGPAHAHGATSSPVSRAVACAPDAATARAAACRAALAASGRAFADWDNVRVADVRGRDRAVIPDGRLCSGGLAAFRGLDLARADWPATRVSPGATFTFRYRQRIPHRGTFRLYVTTDSYQPTRPLRWSDLERRPFLSVTDPRLRGDAYVFSGRLPRDRQGRHIVFAIWQNSDTPDTYYSCSDVVFARRGGGSAATASPGTGPTAGTATGGSGALGPATTGAADGSAPTTGAPVTGAPVTGAAFVPGGAGVLAAGGGAALVALVAFALWRRRPDRRPSGPDRPPFA